ncbi:AMP-binding protein [Streptomyces monticola]|uniref:AMP-binding protein n=1 Tax=Streptomyces monticola TaxID=2666263 RepID=A0ABW2JX30_9ACTN
MPKLTYPEITLDALLRRAAERDPHRAAVTTGPAATAATNTAGATTLTFAELDRQADRIAHRIRATATAAPTATATVGSGSSGSGAVGVAHTLDSVFPAVYYGTARSGRTLVLVNPLVGEAALRHVFTKAGIEIAFVPTRIAELLTKIGDRLPLLRTVVVTDAADGVVPGSTEPLEHFIGRAPEGPAPAPDAGLDDIACIQFTTGTTGRPKGVRLTHRNLVANAVQIALAHRLRDDSVTLNHLPLYHVMHLNSAVYAGASQVLCQDPDPVASLALAARTGATHYYGLPARLHRLAGDDRLDRLDQEQEGIPAGPRLTAVLSGGTALAPAAARRISAALRVPVVQGYGLAELSPLAHNQRLDARPEPGAVGPPVPGTECRIVSLGSRRPVDIWSTGEVQIRGPQLMAGYLDDHGPAPIDADGWFTTGDVGYLDEDGGLHLVDRLGDVFKYDNELVSPSAVERILTEDPRIAECLVVDWPDPVHGALAWAGIVLREPPPGPPALLDALDSVVERANSRLGHGEQIRRVEALDAIPRTPNGKPARRELRQQLRARAALEAA